MVEFSLSENRWFLHSDTLLKYFSQFTHLKGRIISMFLVVPEYFLGGCLYLYNYEVFSE